MLCHKSEYMNWPDFLNADNDIKVGGVQPVKKNEDFLGYFNDVMKHLQHPK